MIWDSLSLKIPNHLFRVVFGRVDTAVKWYPRALLINVDFPTFGRPTIVTNPTRPLPNSIQFSSTLNFPYQHVRTFPWQVYICVASRQERERSVAELIDPWGIDLEPLDLSAEQALQKPKEILRSSRFLIYATKR